MSGWRNIPTESELAVTWDPEEVRCARCEQLQHEDDELVEGVCSGCLDDPSPECGHSACRQNWIDTGRGECVLEVECECCGDTYEEEDQYLQSYWCPACRDIDRLTEPGFRVLLTTRTPTGALRW